MLNGGLTRFDDWEGRRKRLWFSKAAVVGTERGQDSKRQPTNDFLVTYFIRR